MREYQRIRVARQGTTLTIALAYPERRNAIGRIMTNELLWELHDARADEGVRVIVLTGDGTTFCSGGDFAELPLPWAGGAAPPPSARPSPSDLPSKGDFTDLLLGLWQSDKPVVARVNGHAMGGGLGLVAACTFAIASTDAAFGTPEIDVGLFPMIIMAVLERHVPRRRLLEMMLLGQKLDAAEAARLGLVNRAVGPEALDGEVEKLCAALAAKSPTAVRLGLGAVAAQADLALEEALPVLRERLGDILATSDAREGLAAFLEKRTPRWTGS
jgi:enoyl-CoA hydratase/carnithine racemase